MAEGLVGGDGFAADASLIKADANKQRSVEGSQEVDWEAMAAIRRSVREYLDTLDEAAWGAASEVKPKFIAKSDPAAQWTGALKRHAFFAYAVFDNSQRPDGTFERAEFAYDHKADTYICPAGKQLRQRRKIYRLPRPLVDRNGMIRYRASKLDCQCCPLKPRCCPNEPARKIPRSIHEGARDIARVIAATEAYVTSRRERKKVEMLFAHLKRILKLDRLRLRGPNGARDEFHLAATAQNLRKLAKLIPMPEPTPA